MRTVRLLGPLLLCAACAAHRPHPARPAAGLPRTWPPPAAVAAAAAPGAATPRRLDSLVRTPPAAGLGSLLARLVGRGGEATQPLRLGKKSTLSVYYGAATISTAGKNAAAGPWAVAASKSAGPVAGAGGVASDQHKATNPLQHLGDADAIAQRATVAHAGFPWGRVLGGAALALAAGAGWYAWPWLVVLGKRRKKSPDENA